MSGTMSGTMSDTKMSGTKRPAKEMTGADDPNDAPQLKTRRPGQDNDAPPPTQPLTKEEIAAKVKEFSEARLSFLPVNLMSDDFKEYLFWNANHRLERAKADGALLADVTIGDDCLPTWPTFSWDASEESLHEVIEARLQEYEAANLVGQLVREDIIWKSNLKLDEARAQGLELAGLWIGKNLLPPHGDTTLSEVDISPSSDNASATLEILTVPNSSENDSDTGSDTDSDTDSNTNSDDDYDDAISVNNFFDERPYYSDGEDGDFNVLHGAQVVGGPAQFSNVDLEVFVAEHADDLDDLPELELAIDRQAFEHWFGSQEAVDVHVVGARLRCTGELFDVEDVTDSLRDDDDGSVILGEVEDSSEGGDYHDDVSAILREVEGASGAGDYEVVSVAGPFQDTEDGFTW
ncbi:hypothetical protein ACJ41O_003144 [Fusarium nematophilum]